MLDPDTLREITQYITVMPKEEDGELRQKK